MTEQDTTSQAEAAAKAYAENWTKPRLPEAEMAALANAFQAGIKWARENPLPEVCELVEALDGLRHSEFWIETVDDVELPMNKASEIALEALARFKNWKKLNE